jgi:hypothetical protein
MYADGAGLYLQVTGDDNSHVAKSWIYRFALRGTTREMGLGSLSTFGGGGLGLRPQSAGGSPTRA